MCEHQIRNEIRAPEAEHDAGHEEHLSDLNARGRVDRSIGDAQKAAATVQRISKTPISPSRIFMVYTYEIL